MLAAGERGRYAETHPYFVLEAMWKSFSKTKENHFRNATMANPEESQITPKQKAIGYCKDLIDYYERSRIKFRNSWYFSQAATIILSASTPILILGGAPNVVSAIPPALASITGGLAVFRWQENWVITKSTQEALEAELIAFELGVTESYRTTEDIAVEKFITRVNTLHLDRVKEWSTVLLEEKLVSSKKVSLNESHNDNSA